MPIAEPIKLRPGETVDFEYDKRESLIHYTESTDSIEVRLLPVETEEEASAQAAGELITVIDKKTHWIDTSIVRLTFRPVS